MSAPGENYINWEKGIWSWMTTLDHKRIGLMYLFTILTFFFIGGIFAMGIRLELSAPGQTIMDPAMYNRFMTYHGVIMVFMVLVPVIPASLGNFILPMMLGAKDVAFPRLNLASYYIFITGATVAFISLFHFGVDTGWTFYAPYSANSSSEGTVYALLGAFIMGFASILTGLNFMATVHKLRCKGLTWGRLPLFIWATYATSIVQLLATPVVALTLCLLVMEKTFQIGIFDPNLGGDPVLFQHFFWFYSHPAVYIMILPAMGVISDVIPVFSRKPIFGYKAIALATFGIALVAFLVWGHHMFITGQSPLANFIFSLLTMFVAVPTGVKTFSWLATMYKGSIRFNAPMLYALGFIFVFTIGGLTGVYLATIAANVYLTDTYFVVAHFHYVMVGGGLFGLMAGLHHWFPKMFGKMYSEGWAKISWALIFVGFNVTFLPQFIVGTQGMPRRYFDYEPHFADLNFMSTIGAFTIAAGFVIAAFYLLHALCKGRKAGPNPWDAKTLEWQSESPPVHSNFEKDPVVDDWFYGYKPEKV